MAIIFFESAAEFQQWLAENHDKATEVHIGFYKKGANKKGITYSEALDLALCYGWIDAVRHGIDAETWTIRFTPRKPGSIWSGVNINRVAELTEMGQMQPSGLTAFSARQENKSRVYSYERATVTLDEDYEQQFRVNVKAWSFFESQPPSYKKPALWWVMSAKQEATRIKRLAALISNSENGLRVPSLRRNK